MMKFAIVLSSVAALTAASMTPALAVSSSSARQACINAAATQHNALKGNVQVRKVKAGKSGAQVNLVVNDVEVNCMVNSAGKVRYIN
ncbi:hypothetical protein OSH08_12835 [Kaistia geumhonensis]|uniref:PepSY domain-containing protein n=1 Tax=Kaistia geumhonensis TaxID=410839 RepID=A0ABU0M1P8_9HYPH|nr:hypothetical protein [Kaistia geumhonensis]MCX5479897.1 hypothetical protein [Kaistia geumhonensis]MDQ0514876.1 hypothetical protein [Kaistia geumhonensis]